MGSEVDQSAHADVLEVFVGNAFGVVIAVIKVAILDPDRHCCCVDFLDNAAADDLSPVVGGTDVGKLRLREGAASFDVLVLAVENGVTERVPALADTGLAVPSLRLT